MDREEDARVAFGRFGTDDPTSYRRGDFERSREGEATTAEQEQG
jgi:hypothetical protein